MLDIKYIRENLEEAIERLNTRGKDHSYLREIPNLDEERRKIIKETEGLKAKRNETSKLIGQYKREGKDTTEIMASVGTIGEEIKALDEKLAKIDERIKYILLITPNLPNKEIPIGIDEEANKEVRRSGTPRKFDFQVKDHADLGEALGILDFQRATKITGPRFVIYKGLGARLERSLIQFMMDLHSTEHGYKECMPPYLINEASMYGTGQFPKFVEDVYKVESKEDTWYLNPTAEVPTINMYRDEILDGETLPQCFCSYTTAFRSEAGSAGRDTKGILRQHQFNKVELIKFTKPEESYDELEKMVKNSEKVLQLLNLPYRVVTLSTGDMGFGMAKTYDIEVWIPSQNTYREIASISNAEDYQARRASIRFKRTKTSPAEYVHTLNGSGLAVGRTVIAVMENYQNEDGTITIPEVLIPYMKESIIK